MLDEEKSKLKIRSLRTDDETFDNFRAVCAKIGGNQQEGLAKLLEVYNLQASKVLMPEKKDAIDTFERYSSTLVRLYREALEDNLSLTDTIRTEYDSTLQHKDTIIQGLKEQIDTANKEKEKALSEVKMAAAEKDRISKYITSLKDEYESKLDGYEDTLKDKEELNAALKEKINQLNSKLEAMSDNKKALDTLQSDFSELTAKYNTAIKDKESAESALTKACTDHQKAESDHVKELEEIKTQAQNTLEHCKTEMQLAQQKAILELEQKYQATIQKLKEEKQAEIDKYQQKYFDLLEKSSSKK